jgi:hypothetical protein
MPDGDDWEGGFAFTPDGSMVTVLWLQPWQISAFQIPIIPSFAELSSSSNQNTEKARRCAKQPEPRNPSRRLQPTAGADEISREAEQSSSIDGHSRTHF